jgi:DMSO/TMAO reductase YedYZ molybdopterin-dependent catalytic subunit
MDGVSRRAFLRAGAVGAAALGGCAAVPRETAVAPPEPYLTTQDKFRDVSRGKPLPHRLPPEVKARVGLTRESWKLQVIPDPEHPAKIGKPVTLDWGGLQELAAKRTVSFLKIMTCNNIGVPLGMGLWEGVPLRDLVWLTEPKSALRRVFYYGYHNDDPEQRFQSSLPAGRVLEDPHGLPPVIVCTKLNGEFLTSERGGPVRIVVPETYGFKSVKWLTHVVLSDRPFGNDTYADGDNDVDSHLKTFARTLSVPKEVRAGEPIRVTGLAQVGVSGLRSVQTWIAPADAPWPADDPHFTRAPWADASILPAPSDWGGGLPEGRLPSAPHGFDPGTLRPRRWPMPLTKAHWTATLAAPGPGAYVLRCRTIDENGAAQPMPRPFAKSGRAAIESVRIEVRG